MSKNRRKSSPAWVALFRKPSLAGFFLLLIVAAITAGLIPTGQISKSAVPSGPVYASGRDGAGQLGDNGSTNSNINLLAKLPDGVSITAVGGGDSFSLALSSDGKVYAWGDNQYGQLGNGNNTLSRVPVEVSLPVGITATAIAAGRNHALALGNDGNVYAWGQGTSGELGNGATSDSNVPLVVSLPSGVSATAISAGWSNSMALGNDGILYGWGFGSYGDLGTGDGASSDVPVAVSIPTGVTITAVSSGADHTLAIGNDGKLYAWGYNDNGQVGNGGTGLVKSPEVVLLPNGVTAIAISAGLNNSMAVGDDGNLYTWGANPDGELGNGTSGSGTDSNIPVIAQLPAGVTPVLISQGGDFAQAVGSDGKLYVWGYNGNGEFGNGNNTSSNTPLAVSLPGGVTPLALGGGYYHALRVLPPPVISINNVSGDEGNSATTSQVFTATLNYASNSAITASYATADATAKEPSDYTAKSGTLNFASEVTTTTVTVLVNGDNIYEGNETYSVNLTSPTNATISGTNGSGTGTITNDDAKPVLTINDVTLAEGNSGTTPFTFTVTLSAASGVTTTVNYSTDDDTATQPSDYTAISGTLALSPGVTTTTVTVLVNGDNSYEPDETFDVTLSDPSEATIDSDFKVGTGTITNDDSVPQVTIDDVSLTEGNSGTTSFTFTVTLAEACGYTATVNYATLDGTATAPADYVATSGTLTFEPGEITKTVTVLVNGDTLKENSEFFTVSLNWNINSQTGSTSASGTIYNDDALPALSVSNVSQPEGNSGVTPFVFTVTLNQPSGIDTNLVYSTEDNTATAAGNDYQPVTAGALTIPAGQTSANITIPVNGDTVIENDETFNLRVQLAAPAPGSVQTSAPVPVATTGVGTILNDDFKPNAYQPPADLTGQLRVTPDRVAANDALNELSYSFLVKNTGQGKAGFVSLTFPVDPRLSLGYTNFSNPNIWVTSATATEVTINLPEIAYSGEVTGTLVFRPNAAVLPEVGGLVSSRYQLKWTNPAGNNGQSVSNAVSFIFGEAGSNQDVSGGLIQLMTADPPVGSKMTYRSNFWIPNETVSAWLTAPDGTSKTLVVGRADGAGNFAVTVDSLNLTAGTYVVAAYGAKSELYGSGVLVVDSAGSSQSGSATNLKLNSLGAKTLKLAPANP